MDRAEQRARGKAAREALPLEALADVAPADRDPVAIVRADDVGRLETLVPIRHERMAESAFAFYRGSAGLMATDLAPLPRSGLHTQLCGDAHLSNFGLYGSPERALVFDLNDFDETLPGPFEWDVKRLVASMVVAARDCGFKPKHQRAAAHAAASRYRTAMRELADLPALSAWHVQLEVDRALETVDDDAFRAFAAGVAERARGKDHLQAVARLTDVVDGQRRIVPDPPLIVPLPDDLVDTPFDEYVQSVRDDVQVLLGRYEIADAALKVVGVGSVGTRCAIVLLQGSDEHDLLFLQVKEAGTSVLERHLPPSVHPHGGRRVVHGQRLLQSASDAFLGWSDGAHGRHYYWRQLRDWKGSAPIDKMTPEVMTRYGAVCGWALAKAHARAGDRITLAAYMGSSERFEDALVRFACAYADQVERDYAAFKAAS